MDERITKKSIIRRKRKIKKYKNATKFLVLVLVLALFFVFLLDKFVISVLTVEGNSMNKTFYEGDKILVKKIGISKDKIKRDDIIYFKGNDDRYYLKRVIGIPDDVVEIINNKVFVNGVEKIEEYVLGDITETYSDSKWSIASDEYFVLGDNRLRNSSKDSRIFGTINIKQIKGKVLHNFNSER